MADPSYPIVKVTLRVVLVVVAVVLALYLVYLLRTPITWLFIAGFIALAVSGPVNVLARRIRRSLAIAIVYVCLVLFPFGLIALLVPPLVTEANNLIDNLPRYAADLQEFVRENDRLRSLEEDYDITGKIQEEASTLPNRIGDAAGVLSDIGLGVVNSLFAGITILILSIFMVSSGPHFFEWLIERQPVHRRDWLGALLDRIRRAVGNYVAGALLQATVAGVLAWLVLTILGVPYAPALAVIVFLLDLVPLVGATIGAILVGIVTVFSDFPTATIVWTIWSIVYQQVENTVIQPRIQARAVQVHPFVVLVSVLFGSSLFGVLGALLAIPVAATIEIAIREYAAFRRQLGEPPSDDETPPAVATAAEAPPPGPAAPPAPA